jgi:transketolase
LNSLKRNNYGEIIESPKEIFSKTLLELGKKNKNVVFVSCDTSLGSGANEFKKVFPEKHIEFGIQEQNAITASAGLALSGKIPYIGAHIPFIILRCVEQIRDDLCVTMANVNIIGRDFGLQFYALGPTHMVCEDVGILRTLPNLTIIAPSDGPEYRSAIISAAEIDGPVYIRFSRQPVIRVHDDDYIFKVGKGNVLRKGKDLTLIATSTMVSKSVDAAEILSREGIDVEVINIHTLKPIDKTVILESSFKTRKVMTVEEHSVINGLGSAVSDILIKENPVKMRMIGIEDCFPIVGQSYEGLLNYYGLTGPKIAQSIKNFLMQF